MAYDVSTPVFEGPFDLLLHLILKEEVDLYEVSLSTIVDAFLVELDRMQAASAGLDLEVATEFLLIAATLVELKARRLLPGPDDVDVDDEVALWAERDVLLARLIECKTFKDAAQALRRLGDAADLSYPRTVGLEERYLSLAPDLLAGVTSAKLRAAYVRAVTPRPVPTVDLRHVTPVRASVTDAVAELAAALPHIGRSTFRRLTAGLGERLQVVVRFLALLELFKEGLVELEQAAAFGDIEVVWLGADHGRDDLVLDLTLAAVDAYDG